MGYNARNDEIHESEDHRTPIVYRLQTRGFNESWIAWLKSSQTGLSVSSRQFFGWTTIIVHPWIDLLLLDFFQQSATPIKVRLVDVGVTPKLNKVSTGLF
jgi:hypothetical protein